MQPGFPHGHCFFKLFRICREYVYYFYYKIEAVVKSVIVTICHPQTECSRLPFHHSLYLGGFSDMREISGLVATSDRYVGCVQELAFTGHKFDFRRKGTVRESTFGVNVGE